MGTASPGVEPRDAQGEPARVPRMVAEPQPGPERPPGIQIVEPTVAESPMSAKLQLLQAEVHDMRLDLETKVSSMAEELSAARAASRPPRAALINLSRDSHGAAGCSEAPQWQAQCVFVCALSGIQICLLTQKRKSICHPFHL